MDDIQSLNDSLPAERAAIANQLAEIIDDNLSYTERKIWHAHPVWFIDGNPIVGYSSLKPNMRLMFWSGQSFKTPGLSPEGTFKAAEIRYDNVSEIDIELLKQWLKESEKIQWDYKNIYKTKGQLNRLTDFE